MSLAARTRRVADATGRGLVAGAAGSVAITVSSTLEMKARGRPPSDVPAKVAAKALGVRPRRRARARFAALAHLASGLALGVPRGWLAVAGLPPLPREAAWVAIAASPDFALVPLAREAPPPWRWGTAEVLISAAHHLAYAAAASAAYRALETAGD
jgi:hypothetical protein